MKQIPTIFYMVFLLSFTLFSQQTVVKGSVKDLISNQGLAQVAVTFEGILISAQTNALVRRPELVLIALETLAILHG
ncbi:MAG: hypothetical protein P8O96_08525 [Flavobacteriaceae bacterium]|nr:hypothetical protein [Flavobacteriaceae bacterium]